MSSGVVAQLRAAWVQRDLAVRIAVSDHRAENQGLLLGGLWHLLSPLLRIAVYGVVFGLLLAGRRPEGFIAFLAVGLFVFGLLQGVIQEAGTVCRARQSLLTSLYFPRILLPASVVIRQVLAFRFEAAVMVIAILATDLLIRPGWLPFLLVLVPLALVFALGIALLVAVVVARLPDVSRLLPVVFRMLFYLSGVLFPLGTLLEGHPVEALLPLNPFYAYVELSRHLIFGPQPDAGVLWISATAWAVAAASVGVWMFVRRESELVRP